MHDDAGAAHHVPPLPGRLVVYLARTVPVEDGAEINHWFDLFQPNFKPLELGHIEVDSTDS